jgi:minor histocompatibility antigen H13
MEIEPIYIAYASLIAMAMLPIYFGSHLAIEEDAKAGAESERLSSADAYWFPVIGSAALFTFYLVFKFFPKEYVNYLLTAYFGVFGTFAVTKMAVRLAQVVVPNKWEMKGHFHLLLEKPSSAERLIDVNITWLNTICAILSSAFTCYYVWSKHWVASNLFGLAFATSAISMIQLDTFATGMILLAGLFIYDVFWVFGTDVMVSVAKSFDIPVKLLFPRGDSGFSMLGLGDIVIPGT